MHFSLSNLVAAASLLLVGSADEGICQRGWFKYPSTAVNETAYDGAVDFKACQGKQFTSETEGVFGNTYGWWYSCRDTEINGTERVVVDLKYYDSFKCNDGSVINETVVGVVGDIFDENFVNGMVNEFNNPMLMLFDETNTYCDALGTVQCTIETNKIVRYSQSAQQVCSGGAEVWREKQQAMTRYCNNGIVYNCSSGDAYDMTVFASNDCTGDKASYKFEDGGCYGVIKSVSVAGITFGNSSQDELRVLKCHACPPFATVVAFVAAVFAAAFAQ